MLLYIVRHGLTPWNHLHKAQGSADIPLAQEGIDLARRTGEALMDVKFDICFRGSGRAHYENWKYYGVQLQRI